MKQFLLVFLLTTFSLCIFAHEIDYKKSDSIKITAVLNGSKHLQQASSPILYFARSFLGTPYVANTLETNTTEKLIINTDQLDCTTFVETVLSLYLCYKNKQFTFDDYCRHLRYVRYANGNVSYTHRLHYLTTWLDEKQRTGILSPAKMLRPPYCVTKVLKINFMTQHSSLYPMMHNNPYVIAAIKKMEDSLLGRKLVYIPKLALKTNQAILKQVIHNGDIIGLTSTVNGLDFAHVAIAVWKGNHLHIIHASSAKKKVIEDTQNIYQYLIKIPKQSGLKAYNIKQ